jgi:hypothetical protein
VWCCPSSWRCGGARAGVALVRLLFEAQGACLKHKALVCKFVVHFSPYLCCSLKWLQVCCLEGFGVVLHKLMEVWRC